VAERIARYGLYLPSGLALEEAQIDRVCEALREALG
jgi:dTDP-4-amino-4,6-dideoxygalactose transaminase